MNNPNTNRAGWLAGMNRKNLLIRSLGLLVAALCLSPATAQAATYGFTLGPPNPATDGSNVIRLSGGGTFDTTLGSVLATGAYSIKDSSGKVTERGTWSSSAYVNFISLGGLAPGVQGGVLQIMVRLRPNGGTAGEEQLMTVVCPFEEEEDEFHEDEDGTTVGPFATILPGGITVFHLIKP